MTSGILYLLSYLHLYILHGYKYNQILVIAGAQSNEFICTSSFLSSSGVNLQPLKVEIGILESRRVIINIVCINFRLCRIGDSTPYQCKSMGTRKNCKRFRPNHHLYTIETRRWVQMDSYLQNVTRRGNHLHRS